MQGNLPVRFGWGEKVEIISKPYLSTLVNIKTINGVRAITNLSGYNSIDLVPPTMLIQGDDFDD